MPAGDEHPSIVLVGESPPPGAPADFKPFDCASGSHLARLLGFTSRGVLLEHVPRDNIFDTPGVGIGDGPKWDDAGAKARARALIFRHFNIATFVALGAKPSTALGVGDLPWYAWRRDADTKVHLLSAPHPSGRSSIITASPSGPTTFRRALLPDIIVGCPTLRPWHFATSNEAVRADLGAALCPYDPAVGVIAVALAAEAHASPALMADIHKASAGMSLRTIIRALAPAPGVTHKTRTGALADIFRCRQGADLKARVASAERTVVGGYPPEVLRATIGRYAALGVL